MSTSARIGPPLSGWCKTAAVFNHEPAHYRCPFCAFVRGEWDDHNAATDLVAREELAFARIAPKWWPDNPGSAWVIPTGHFVNLYDIPAEVGHEDRDLTRPVVDLAPQDDLWIISDEGYEAFP